MLAVNSARRALLVLAALSGLAACKALPKNARGQTPMRYVLCNAQGEDCFVAARFSDLHSCERYRTFALASCDEATQPGKLICDTAHPSTTKSSYCLSQ